MFLQFLHIYSKKIKATNNRYLFLTINFLTS